MFFCVFLSVCQEAASLCETLSATKDAPLDMAPELTRAVTNVVCSLCFNSAYQRGDPEFEAMLQYSQGIVDTVAKEGLVDIFPWLQVREELGWRKVRNIYNVLQAGFPRNGQVRGMVGCSLK